MSHLQMIPIPGIPREVEVLFIVLIIVPPVVLLKSFLSQFTGTFCLRPTACSHHQSSSGQAQPRRSKPVLVGDVVGVSSLATRLSTGSTGLQVKFLATSLQLVNAVLGPARQVNVNRGPHASAEVGGAGVDVTILLIETEVLASLSLNGVLDGLDTLGQSAEHFPDISSLPC